jgi:hypothetical protein
VALQQHINRLVDKTAINLKLVHKPADCCSMVGADTRQELHMTLRQYLTSPCYCSCALPYAFSLQCWLMYCTQRNCSCLLAGTEPRAASPSSAFAAALAPACVRWALLLHCTAVAVWLSLTQHSLLLLLLLL